jgi:hypothetical protein
VEEWRSEEMEEWRNADFRLKIGEQWSSGGMEKWKNGRLKILDWKLKATTICNLTSAIFHFSIPPFFHSHRSDVNSPRTCPSIFS